LIEWRFASSDVALETAVRAALASYRGRVSWVARKDDEADAWGLVPLKLHVFRKQHPELDDAASEFFHRFPEVCREAVLDIADLSTHLRAALRAPSA
jgi:hypothetical protein